LDYLTTHTSLSPIRRGFAPGFVNYQKGCTRLAATSDKVYQLLAHGRWFSPGTPASSTTKTGRHDIAEILLKVALNTKKSNQINLFMGILFNFQPNLTKAFLGGNFYSKYDFFSNRTCLIFLCIF
jgi:hypothetical protein